MRVKIVKHAKLPTLFGKFIIVGFKEILTGKDHFALTYGDISNSLPVLSRIHSECITGDAMFSLRCDCGFQLKSALQYIVKEKRGIILYHRQEGRNIGLLNKIRAYNLQDHGYDTIEANKKLGFCEDERNFSLCANMLKALKIQSIRLLTNNPKKIKVLTKYGINIVERIPLIVGRNSYNSYYLDTKLHKMGHLL
ncbi:MAG: GTP cyclohydrolase II [Enterobacterales bacterium]